MPLLSEAEFERIVYDPPNRRIEVSHRRRFTGALRRVIEVRDRHCQHPAGCDVPAADCDVDHIIPHALGGPTCLCNGRLLCATHNRITTNHGPRPVPSTATGSTDTGVIGVRVGTDQCRGRHASTMRARMVPERREDVT